ncbi:glutathione S-transferase family protein [Paraconexibacter antarcticus]|uniref:Glutathione S-transferase family protein n=1 Tax=Paraconexibacter antarcticus TaxID=2949664 RepID=A0ABY5DW14_9ACTN|nr:glutathione S-transferase family protein [Paraconexibacter antarcticus]UTI65665.1 glutathione S-transferase family protein [Paraconexibacter antarcticus]
MTPRTAAFPKESDDTGAFVRQDSTFRDRVTADGSSGLPAVAGRYHLYVSLACPWAHRAVIVRRLKGLEDAIGLTVVDPIRDDETGWRFAEERPDPLNGWTFLKEAYEATDPGFDGRVSVPVLWDTVTGRIVNNESADVIEMLATEFDEVAGDPDLDLYPAALRDDIDALNARVYETVNNGVYRAGFAPSQEAYEDAVMPLFATLDELDVRLTRSRFLFGDRQTLADWRLFTTLVRFDAVYHGHFKCNLRKISEYPALSGYLRDLYQTPGVAQTVDMDHIKRHYYVTHTSINPTQIVPLGPLQDLHAPHGREAPGA